MTISKEIFKGRNWLSFAGCINVLQELNEPDVSRILRDNKLHTIQFVNKPSDRTWNLLNDSLFSKRPDVWLKLTKYSEPLTNFDFLLRMNNLRSLSVMLYDLKSIEVFGELSQLEGLILERTASKNVSLSPLLKLSNLAFLWIEGFQKDIEVLSCLTNLQVLELRSITVENLNFLRALDKLERLSVVLGGTKNFAALVDVPLTHLTLWQVRQLSDIEFISQLRDLEYLQLDSLRNVERLPSFCYNHDKITRLNLNILNGLRDISSLATLTNLEEFLFGSARNFIPSDFIVLRGCKKLRVAKVGFGSSKKNREFEDLMTSMGVKRYHGHNGNSSF